MDRKKLLDVRGYSPKRIARKTGFLVLTGDVVEHKKRIEDNKENLVM